MNVQYVALKGLPGVGIVRTAARHNLREIQAELGPGSRIDASRTHLNMVLSGPDNAEAVAERAANLMADAGVVKPRKNALRAVELMVSLPPESDINVAKFFADALAWAREFFAVPILSAITHLDEAQDHMHVLLLPLINGRMVGSDLMGDRSRLRAIQANFNEMVGARYGLRRANASRSLSGAAKRNAARDALDCLARSPHRVTESNVRQALLNAIAANPEPVLAALGLAVPVAPKREATFVEIMTRQQKPEPRATSIGFDRSSIPIGV
ncbi:plasmid recombination protein [Cupriavidus sp. CV2]|uniref:plasmid recombination protein n=1 Tax=Cupriavidus ulmosensis TaxID=3065913 RepID=UPI00296ACD7F|nr:plasmid recombination protein [Cupriavidus sp. CV2]MDW3684008.1 plasmid recombination protein [Cupriavidus sp. CV2]